MTVTPLRHKIAANTRPTPATFTVREVAALLGVGPSTVYQMLRSGELPARRAGDRWIISRRRVLAWLDGDDQVTASTADAASAGGAQ